MKIPLEVGEPEVILIGEIPRGMGPLKDAILYAPNGDGLNVVKPVVVGRVDPEKSYKVVVLLIPEGASKP